jgi:hypothetical protein
VNNQLEPAEPDPNAGDDWNNRRQGRYYVIRKASTNGVGPWVLAEVVDWDYAETWYFAATVLLSRREALADPAYSGAVLAWDRRQDEAYRAWWAAVRAQLQEVGGDVREFLLGPYVEDRWREIMSSGELGGLDELGNRTKWPGE